MGEWPCAVLGDEIRAGNIRAVLNLGGHLVTAFPDANDLVPALRSLDVFATIEIIGNDTTALSTHVLPTKDQLERADVTLWDSLLPRVAAQHTPAIVDPVGDRRSTWWVLAELGRRLGHELALASGEDVTDDAVLAKHRVARSVHVRRTGRERLGRERPTSCRRNGWTTMSTDSVAGGSRPKCWSTSSRRSRSRTRHSSSYPAARSAT